ncbi:MAG: lycopene cyclase domain-containing protein, partial [Thermoplasmatota archaeon]
MNYLVIDILILLGPLLFTFEPRIRYYRKLPAVAFAIGTAGGAYIIWDAIATARGDWAFADSYVVGIRLLDLPLEEILFFMVVPYSCLFIYEALKLVVRERNLPVPAPLYVGLILLLVLLAVIYHRQDYTILALSSLAAFLLLALIGAREVLASARFWLYMLLSYMGFLIFNYLLTSIPIVTYADHAIWGIRITTIPVEDFLYNFSMLGFYFVAYRWAMHRLSLD